MRTQHLTTAFIAFSLFAFTACSGGEAPQEQTTTDTERTTAPQAIEAHEHHEHAHYQCPMKCEDDKTYEEPGTCPVCGMELAEVKE
ncbi:MAG: hypothetical protein H6592_13160 [Flavobacteriales bacterium]|nr:hypothetical protein [Flavobacteriales bacterium]HPF91378.1 heavy metal-binding domain-containing protein [Flavobacteriales bacterium]